MKILLVEDEPFLGEVVKESLESRGLDVKLCLDGLLGWKAFKTESFDLVILDIMMPNLDGISLAKRIRKEHLDIPIIFLTAKTLTKDVIEGFQAGANDYIKKPFSMEELIVRIQHLLKTERNTNKVFQIGSYQFNAQKQVLQYKDEVTKLSHRESELLFYLYQHKNELLERNWILKKLWGDTDYFNARSMDVYISKLRKKLHHDTSVEIINIRGFGYKLIT